MKIKNLIISILIPIGIGLLSALISGNMDLYQKITTPTLAPPAIIFPIVWTILYILMGISSYIINNSDSYDKDGALLLYAIQLFINFIWSPIFFKSNNFLLSFIIIILLIGLVIAMILQFFKVNKISAYLQIPYLLWLLFAAYLNFSIYILN